MKDGTIYLQKEARIEVPGAFDWRLPGGKVVDTFAEYKKYFTSPLPKEMILKAALKELAEEAGLTGQAELFTKKVCGATVEWDLYYVVVTNVTNTVLDHEHNEGEQVEKSGWFSFEEIRSMAEKGEIGEGRSVAALLEYLHR